MTRFEDLEIGIPSGKAEIVIDDAAVDEFLDSMEIDDPIFRHDGLQRGKRLAPSHLAPKLALYPLYGDFIEVNFGGAVFAKQAFTFHAPVWVGTIVHATAKVLEKYERRGKNFVVFEGIFKDSDGGLLVVERRTTMPLVPTFRMT